MSGKILGTFSCNDGLYHSRSKRTPPWGASQNSVKSGWVSGALASKGESGSASVHVLERVHVQRMNNMLLTMRVAWRAKVKRFAVKRDLLLQVLHISYPVPIVFERLSKIAQRATTIWVAYWSEHQCLAMKRDYIYQFVMSIVFVMHHEGVRKVAQHVADMPNPS